MLRLDALLLLLIIAVIAPLLYPVYADLHSRKNGFVEDGTGQPIPGAVLNFLDDSGKIIASDTADERGQFWRGNLSEWSRKRIAGYVFTHTSYNTGALGRYYFTPIGVQEARFTNAYGKPMSALPVDVQFNGHTPNGKYTYEKKQYLTDWGGIIHIENIGVGEELHFYCNDPRYVEQSRQVIKEPRRIRFNITLAVPGHLHGRVTGAKGKFLRGYMVFLTRTPDSSNYGDRILLEDTTNKLAFARDNLAPGTYYLSASPPGSNKAIHSVRRFTIASGQHLEIKLPLP